MLELCRADVDCVDEILAILNSASSWLSSRGVEQWPKQFTVDQVLPIVMQGHTWLARLDGEPAGTITLDWSDILWDSRSEDAGYVHRLAVLRSASGLGRRLLEWAGETARRRGRSVLRLDCVATNHKLRMYYEAAGFRHRGDVVAPYSKPFRADDSKSRLHSRYERDLIVCQPEANGPADVVVNSLGGKSDRLVVPADLLYEPLRSPDSD